jgi:hypothetical protein
MGSHDNIWDRLATAAVSPGDGDEPVEILRSELAAVGVADLPDGLRIQVIDKIDAEGIRHVTFNGTLGRDGGRMTASIEETGWRKWWPGPLGVDDYHALVLAAVQARASAVGDVSVKEMLDDNLHGVVYEAELPDTGSLRTSFERALSIRREVNEAAEAVSAGVQDLVERTRQRLAGWGAEPLDALVGRVASQVGTANQRGIALEELTTRLFNTIPGFQATGRVKTSTEEIDIRIQNSSEAGRWQRETFLLLAECKNWSGKCGKDEFVLFKSKLANRVGRVSCGFLVSWNGFAETITKEMLRGSQSDIVVVALDGSDLRNAVRDGDFGQRLEQRYDESVFA